MEVKIFGEIRHHANQIYLKFLKKTKWILQYKIKISSFGAIKNLDTINTVKLTTRVQAKCQPVFLINNEF